MDPNDLPDTAAIAAALLLDDRNKAVVKEALKEWMDDKFSSFGKWTVGALAATGLYFALWFFFTLHAWRVT